jgi:hypothetical protein
VEGAAVPPATLFLDVALHALVKSVVPLIETEIATQTDECLRRQPRRRRGSSKRQHRQKQKVDDTASDEDGESGAEEDNEDGDQEAWCSNRTVALALFELATDSSVPLRMSRDSVDMRVWSSLVNETLLAVMNNSSSLSLAGPSLVEAIETVPTSREAGGGHRETVALIARALCSSLPSEGKRAEQQAGKEDQDWVDVYLADSVLADSALSLRRTEEGGGPGSKEAVFWPRTPFKGEDVRFANLALASLAFETTSESAFFEPCAFLLDDDGDDEDDQDDGDASKVLAISEAVDLLAEAERSACDAETQVKETLLRVKGSGRLLGPCH